MSDVPIPRKALEELFDHMQTDVDRRAVWQLTEDYYPSPGNLFGKKAFHQNFGEGIIVTDKPDYDGDVRVAFKSEDSDHGSIQHWLRLSELEVDE